MKLIALGTGSAFTLHKGNFQTNFIVERNGKRLLVDAGDDLRWSLRSVGLTFKDIDAVYVSHPHGDHVHGLEFLGFCRYFTREADLKAMKPDPTQLPLLICDRSLMGPIWDTLKHAMGPLDDREATLDDYFHVHCPDDRFWWQAAEFRMTRGPHVGDKMPSFGLMIDSPDTERTTYVTTDVAFDRPTLEPRYDEAHLIIHDCQTRGRCNVHPAFDDLCQLPDKMKAKMLLTHYQDNVLDEWDEWQKKAWDNGFQGFLSPSQTIPL